MPVTQDPAPNFLAALSLCGKNALEVVASFNASAREEDRVRNVRWCLISGGIMSSAEEAVQLSGTHLVVTLLYDEGCFRAALQELTEER